MAQKPPQNSLDNLMKTYADLNSTGKSSFKGPALKDVKVQKSSVTAFQPSQKARDWSSLEQSLESVFSVQDRQQQKQSQLPFQPQFQSVQPNQVEEEDEFSDFVGPNNASNAGIGTRLATFQDESPVHQFKPKPPDPQPARVVQPMQNFAGFPDVQDDEDDFGDFAAPIPPVAPISSVAPMASNASIAPSVASVTPMASVAPIAPVAQVASFAPVNTGPIKPLPNFTNPSIPKDSPLELQPNISSSVNSSLDFANIQPIPLNISNAPKIEIKPNLKMPEIVKSPTSVKPSLNPLQPTLNTNSNDKYSALRDLLMDDNPLDQAEQHKSLPVLESITTEEDDFDDFGDFVTTTVQEPQAQAAPMSLPISDMFKPKSLLPDETVFTSNKPKPQVEDKFVPWLDSSPPPPPDDVPEEIISEEMNVEGFLNDDPFFGSTGQEPIEDLSIASLNLRSITPKIESMEPVMPMDPIGPMESMQNVRFLLIYSEIIF